jgi:hypothetical protein
MNRTPILLSLCLALAGVAGALAQSDPHHRSAATSHGGLSVNTSNGTTVVTYEGKEVFRGPTHSHVAGHSASTNGVTWAAAFEGDRVLWENQPGAADHLKAVGPVSPPHHLEAPRPPHSGQTHTNFHTQTATSQAQAESIAAISVKTVDHQTVVIYEGKEIPVGQTHGHATAKAKTLHGVAYAAAFDGERVLWENVPGAAVKVR